MKDRAAKSVTEYPVNLNLENRPCLVIGGGKVAERKVAALLQADAQVTVISPTLTEPMTAWAASGRLIHRAEEFSTGTLQGYLLVLCATDSPVVNTAAANLAKAAGALVNVADQPELCDFTIPARLLQGDLSITVSTGGQSPALARVLRDELAERYGKEYGEYLAIAARLRQEWQATCESSRERCQRWSEVRQFNPEVLELLRQGRYEEAEVKFRYDIGCTGTQS
jgi:precorrin-2 dehydrogenase/sirohydrochlorin ferrochelatase